ncbi:hypothetical protein DDP54_15775 (plasmid) [Cellulomonas sp. WB94]|nr:hypothetical protein DDP54_15775 [Cellulomonas sp. WB94]
MEVVQLRVRVRRVRRRRRRAGPGGPGRGDVLPGDQVTFVGRPPRGLSYSQRSSFTRCGEAYRLTKMFRVPENPAWNLIGGSAVHKVTELEDLAAHGADVKVLTFAEALQLGIDEAVEKSGLPESEFRASGRKSNAWPDKENKAWWLHHGPVMVQRWRDFVRTVPWDLAEFPDAEGELRPAVEIELDIQVSGTTIKAFVDRVFRRRADDALVVVDLKSGADPSAPISWACTRWGSSRRSVSLSRGARSGWPAPGPPLRCSRWPRSRTSGWSGSTRRSGSPGTPACTCPTRGRFARTAR